MSAGEALPHDFVGTVYGNVLDKYDNVGYNARLYMIPPVAGGGSGGGASNPRGNQGASGGGQGGYMSGSYVADAAQTVVLAQTGVTGNQIDNIQITAAAEGGPNNFVFSKCSFDVIQPGAANFLDQMIAAKAKIGAPVFSNDVPLFLEIVFKGYTEDITDTAAEGVPTTVAGPYYYPLIISTINLEIDEKGSIYNFDCVINEASAFQDTYYKLPATLTAHGKTVKDFVDALRVHIADYHEEHNTDYGVKDIIEFDLSGLIQSAGASDANDQGCYLAGDGVLTTNSDARAEDINRIMNPELLDKTPDEYEDILEDNEKDTGTLDIVVDEDRVTFREGISMETFFATVLSMSEEFFHKLTRTENADEPEGKKTVDKSKSFVKWFRMNASVEYIDYDYNRNRYAKKITYRPTIFNISGQEVQYTSEEQVGLSAGDVQSRAAGAMENVFKAYHYIYTGRNDQIINCRIAYNAGHTLIVPPAGGVHGDFSTVHSPTMTDQISIDRDATNQDDREGQKKALTQREAEKQFDNMFSGGDAGQDQIRAVGQLVGLSDAEIKQAQSDKSSQSAKILKNILSDQRLSQALRDAQTAQNRNTQSDAVRNTEGGTSTAPASGYIYSADIIDSVSERLDQATSLEAARARVTTLRAQFKSKGETSDAEAGDLTDNLEPGVQQVHVTNPTEAATFDGTARNSIFGYIMQQHMNTDFLVNLDLEIRGDPWYLGAPNRTSSVLKRPAASLPIKSEPDGIEFTKRENFVFFELQTPRLFDWDVADEDNNTGYWSPAGTSYFVSGVYFVKTVVSSFSNGLFSQDLNLIKNAPIKVSKLKKAS